MVSNKEREYFHIQMYYWSSLAMMGFVIYVFPVVSQLLAWLLAVFITALFSFSDGSTKFFLGNYSEEDTTKKQRWQVAMMGFALLGPGTFLLYNVYKNPELSSRTALNSFNDLITPLTFPFLLLLVISLVARVFNAKRIGRREDRSW